MAIIGGELAVFLIGILYLLKGSVKLSKTRTAHGAQVRLAGLIFMLPIALTVLIATITGSPQNSFLLNAVLLLSGAVGIILSIMGVLIGFLVVYSAPSDTQ